MTDKYVRLPDDVELTDSPWLFAVDVTDQVARLHAKYAMLLENCRERERTISTLRAEVEHWKLETANARLADAPQRDALRAERDDFQTVCDEAIKRLHEERERAAFRLRVIEAEKAEHQQMRAERDEHTRMLAKVLDHGTSVLFRLAESIDGRDESVTAKHARECNRRFCNTLTEVKALLPPFDGDAELRVLWDRPESSEEERNYAQEDADSMGAAVLDSGDEGPWVTPGHHPFPVPREEESADE